MARPTLFTRERTARIIELVAAGNPQEVAAKAAGVSEATFYSWCARGRVEQERLEENPKARPKKTETPFLEFLEDIQKARAEADARLVLLIHRAAQEPRTWQAAAWLLERRDPAKWGRTSREKAQAEEQGATGEVQEAVSKMVEWQQPLPEEQGREAG